MATRRKINKKITKSICLSERYWSILSEIAEANGMSNGDAVRDSIIAYAFIDNKLQHLDDDFNKEFWRFYAEAKKIDEQTIFNREESKNPFNESFSRLMYGFQRITTQEEADKLNKDLELNGVNPFVKLPSEVRLLGQKGNDTEKNPEGTK